MCGGSTCTRLVPAQDFWSSAAFERIEEERLGEGKKKRSGCGLGDYIEKVLVIEVLLDTFG